MNKLLQDLAGARETTTDLDSLWELCERAALAILQLQVAIEVLAEEQGVANPLTEGEQDE